MVISGFMFELLGGLVFACPSFNVTLFCPLLHIQFCVTDPFSPPPTSHMGQLFSGSFPYFRQSPTFRYYNESIQGAILLLSS